MDRGVVLNELERFGVEEIELDEPGAGEARVRIEASGVCHSDLHVVRTGFNHPMPVLLGHEGAGVVEAVGEGVEHVGAGDRVVIGWRAPCGECPWCLRGAGHLCRTPAMAARRMHTRDGRDLMGAMRAGTFASRTVVHAASLVALPDGLSAEEACLIGCAVATGVCSVLKTAEVWEGARVDVVGWPETVALGLRMLGHAGTLVYIGLPQPGSEALVPLDRTFDRRQRILVSHGGDHVPAEDFPLLMALAAEGRLDLAGMVTKRIELDGVEAAFEDMEAGEVIRSVIVL